LSIGIAALRRKKRNPACLKPGPIASAFHAGAPS